MGAVGLGGFEAGLEQQEWRSLIVPDISVLDKECLLAAEESANKVLVCIQPTSFSEKRRSEIIEYLQFLLSSHCDCKAIPYGSVPLRTYLPDGDIDFTVIKGNISDDSIAGEVFDLISKEKDNKVAIFKILDPRAISGAEVKLVKCIVENVVVDISFNQLGGLSTLCFLEMVDSIIGRNHLFKRSIILIKAWCHYDSRLLGSNHGLLSTYALEILILYIINHFHSSLQGPLAVLYQFLSYYGQFDWDTYGISLRGPVRNSSLPSIEALEAPTSTPLLTDIFINNCMHMFSVSSRMAGGSQRVFRAKHLNIIDPLNASNNLGRSVARGSFYRIRNALKYAAFKLTHVLSQPREQVSDELSDFFKSTLKWNKRHISSSFHHKLLADLTGDYRSYTGSLLNGQSLISPVLLHVAPNVHPVCSIRPRMPRGSINALEMGPNSVPVLPNMDLNANSPQPLQRGSSENFNRARRSRGTGTFLPCAERNSRYVGKQDK